MDAKLVTVAKRSETQPGVACAVWWALLDYASQNSDRGSVAGFDCEFAATFFGWPEETIERVIGAMRDKGLLTGDHITNWEKRQPQREDNSTDRVRNFRQRRRGGETEVKRSETQRNARTDERRGDENRGDEERSLSERALHPPGEMAEPKNAPSPPVDQSPGEVADGRRRARVDERRRFDTARAWADSHPDEFQKIERRLDRDLARLEPGPMQDEVRRGRLVGEIMRCIAEEETRAVSRSPPAGHAKPAEVAHA